jgi:hypothetical protein
MIQPILNRHCANSFRFNKVLKRPAAAVRSRLWPPHSKRFSQIPSHAPALVGFGRLRKLVRE